MEPNHIIDYSEKVIEIHNLYKAFGSNEVLKGIDLDVYKGENVVVLGRSGTGKSVLIKILCGLLKQDKGTALVLGNEVGRLRLKALHALRLRLGFSFQNSALYDSMTVRENLEFPLVRNRRNLTRREVAKAIDTVLHAVGLGQTLYQMPSELSGGQRKRIGIARTLILQPEIMMYDEPTAGLDPITSIEINSLINDVKDQFNTTSIIITHDLTCAKTTGDRVAMLLDGKFIKQGTFKEVFETNDERIKSFHDYNFITPNPNEA